MIYEHVVISPWFCKHGPKEYGSSHSPLGKPFVYRYLKLPKLFLITNFSIHIFVYFVVTKIKLYAILILHTVLCINNHIIALDAYLIIVCLQCIFLKQLLPLIYVLFSSLFFVFDVSSGDVKIIYAEIQRDVKLPIDNQIDCATYTERENIKRVIILSILKKRMNNLLLLRSDQRYKTWSRAGVKH